MEVTLPLHLRYGNRLPIYFALFGLFYFFMAALSGSAGIVAIYIVALAISLAVAMKLAPSVTIEKTKIKTYGYGGFFHNDFVLSSLSDLKIEDDHLYHRLGDGGWRKVKVSRFWLNANDWNALVTLLGNQSYDL